MQQLMQGVIGGSSRHRWRAWRSVRLTVKRRILNQRSVFFDKKRPNLTSDFERTYEQIGYFDKGLKSGFEKNIFKLFFEI